MFTLCQSYSIPLLCRATVELLQLFLCFPYQTEPGQDTLEEEEAAVFDDEEASSVSLPT